MENKEQLENKVIFEGTILNEIKLSQFGTTLLRLQNKREFKKRDGTAGSSSCTVVVSLRDKAAQAAVDRFKRGEMVRVEGSLMLKKTDKIDQNGTEVWETWISGYSINALANMQSVIPQKSLEERMGYNPATNPPARGPAYIAKALPNKPPYKNPQGSSFDNQPLPIPTEDPNNVFEEVFTDELPF